jgi:shikimate dehydrogenase
MINSCVIGWPIAHSRSPLIHGYWLKKYGIEGSYTRRPVEPASLAAFIADLPQAGFAGCNVTLPHKEAVFGLVTRADETTERLGAVNTVYLRDGNTLGTNTDGDGFINSLRSSVPGFNSTNGRVMVLGAGGASLAVVNAVLEQGASEVVVANRTLEKAEHLRRRFGRKVLPLAWHEAADQFVECGLLVNTTSLGMKGQPELVVDLSRLPAEAVVTDIVYTPLRTKLLVDASARGNRTVDGLGMLLHQAVRGFSLWFGVTPQVTDELHDLVAKDIDPDYRR